MKMAIIVGKAAPLLLVSGMALILTGCGLTQRVADNTVAMTQAIFYKQVKTLHLDIRSREALNSNTRGEALSAVIRIYQLKECKTFNTTDYPSLFASDSQALKADLLAEKDIHLQPGSAVMVNMPMEQGAQCVAVAGLFLSPDLMNNRWRVTISRSELNPDKARIIEAGDNRLTLKPLEDD